MAKCFRMVAIHFFNRQHKSYFSQIETSHTNQTSGQDGGIGKHGSPPHTSMSKLQLKYRKIITQNHQKQS